MKFMAYSRNAFFHSEDCKAADYAERVREKRAQKKPRRMWIKVAGKKVGVLRWKTIFELGKAAAKLEVAAKYPLPKGKLEVVSESRNAVPKRAARPNRRRGPLPRMRRRAR